MEGGKNRYASDIDSSRVEIVESWGLSASKGSKMLCKLIDTHAHTHIHSRLPRHVIVPFWHLLSPFFSPFSSAFWRYFRFGVLFRFSFEFALNFRYFSVLRCLFWLCSLPIFCPLIFVVIIFDGEWVSGGAFLVVGFCFYLGVPFCGVSSSGCLPLFFHFRPFPTHTHTHTHSCGLNCSYCSLLVLRPFAAATPAYTLFYYIKCFTATSPLFSLSLRFSQLAFLSRRRWRCLAARVAASADVDVLSASSSCS